MKTLLTLALMLIAFPANAGIYSSSAISTDTTTCVQTYHNGEAALSGIPYFATVNVKGTWDGATVTWTYKYDTTEYPLKDYTGVQVTSTDDDSFSVEFGRPAQRDLYICGTTTSVGTTSLVLSVMDNN